MTLSVRRLFAESSLSGRPIRVAQIITKLSAGAGSITLHGALALDPSRFAVTILAPEGGTLSPRAEAAGVAMVPLGHMAPELDVRSDWLGLRELVQVLGRAGYDVVHTHSAKAGALGRVAAHRVGVPAIVHSFHGFPFHDFQSVARRRAYLAVERRLARLTHQFVTDGTWTAAEAVRLGIAPPDRVRAISSPIDTDVPSVTEATRARARRLLGLPLEAEVVGVVARLDPQKAPQVLVRALAALARPKVYVVWVGGGSLLPKVQDLVRRYHLEGRFLLMGSGPTWRTCSRDSTCSPCRASTRGYLAQWSRRWRAACRLSPPRSTPCRRSSCRAGPAFSCGRMMPPRSPGGSTTS